MRKLIITIIVVIITACGLARYIHGMSRLMSLVDNVKLYVSSREAVDVETMTFSHDMDKDSIDDLDDICRGAREEAGKHTYYHSAYYKGGYPPDNEGTCTDVAWRAFKYAGYDLKEMVDKDIHGHVELYPRVGGHPDPNIDFRRVPNLEVFFKRHADILTTEIIPWSAANLKKWQRGDIVVFDSPVQHIAIISDRRRRDGVPYIIHNCGPIATEEDMLQRWSSPLKYHFRYPDVNDKD